MIEAKITGDKAVFARLEKLPARLQAKAIESAVRKVMAPMVRDARARVPVDLGLLKKSLGIVVRKYKGGGVVWAGLGARSGFKARIGTKTRGAKAGSPVFSNPANYAHLVERGTSTAAAQPFLRPAFDAHQGKALELFGKVLGKAVDKETAKLAKEGGGR